MDCEQEEPYESVVFRNSQIVYPPDLAAPLVATDSSLLSSSSSKGPEPNAASVNTRRALPRHSVLQAFDPVLQNRKSVMSVTGSREKPKNLELLSEIDFNTTGSSPPPLPKRNASVRVHQYDPVSIEDGLVQLQAQSKCDTPSSEDEGFPACPSTPQNKASNKVKGLINRVNNDLMNSFRRLSPAKTVDVTDSQTPKFGKV